MKNRRESRDSKSSSNKNRVNPTRERAKRKVAKKPLSQRRFEKGPSDSNKKPQRRPRPASLREPRPDQAQANTAWSSPAKWYDNLVGQEGSEYHRQVVLPGVERLIKNAFGQIEGLKIADLACGQGVLCRRLAKGGAEVLGLDLAPELIVKAEEYNKGLTHKPQYKVMDITQLVDLEGNFVPQLEPNSFDVITLVLALQNIDYITALWRGVSGLLQPDGVFIAVMMHPYYRIPQHSDWLLQPKQKRQSRLVWNYLSSKEIDIVINPGQAAHGGEPVLAKHFHRPWQAYVNTMANAGLLVEHMEEWTSHKEEQEGRHKLAKDTARDEIPLFLAFRCRKIDTDQPRLSIQERQLLEE